MKGPSREVYDTIISALALYEADAADRGDPGLFDRIDRATVWIITARPVDPVSCRNSE